MRKDMTECRRRPRADSAESNETTSALCRSPKPQCFLGQPLRFPHSLPPTCVWFQFSVSSIAKDRGGNLQFWDAKHLE